MTYVNLPLDGTALVTSVNGQTGVVELDKDDVGLGNVDNTSDITKNAAAVSLTNKTIDADLNTITNIENADIKAAAGIAVNKLAALTANRALISDASGFLSASGVTATILEYLDATSSVQTQLNGKQATGNYITALTGEGSASGPGSASLTLDNAAVIAKLLTAYSKAAGTVAATDSILQAIQKLDGNDDAKTALATLTTKGDMYVATAASTVVRQAVGTNGYVIMADSGATNGLGYALPVNDSQWKNNVGGAASVGSSALTVSIKNSAGSDASATSPIYISFGSGTINQGQFSVVALTGALSLVISNGSTLGTISGIASDIYVYAINSAGTMKIGVSRLKLPENQVWTTVAEGGAGGADSAIELYSDAVYTDIRIRCLYMLTSTQAAAGVWATAPSALTLGPLPDQLISCSYNTNAAQSITNNTNTTLAYEDRIKDQLNLWRSDTFEAPLDGWYKFDLTCELAATTTFVNTEEVNIRVLANSVSYFLKRFYYTAENTTKTAWTGGTVWMNRKETALLRYIQISGGDLARTATETTNMMSIAYIGAK